MDRGYYMSLAENEQPSSEVPEGVAPDIGLSPENIGISAPPFGDQLQGLKAKVFQGASKVELGFMGKGKGSMQGGNTTPEMFGKDERMDIRELAKVNKIQLTTHATPNAGSLAGFQQDRFDEAIVNYVKRKYNLAIGENTAEEIKTKIGCAIPLKPEATIEIRGRDLAAGLPKNIKLTSTEISEALQESLQEIIVIVKALLRETPPELSADIMDKGMIISGGGALLKNIDQLISQTTGVPCFIAEDPLTCVARGAGAVLDNLEAYKRSIMIKK